MHKSIGIITHYYNSTNYGGVLQSYALCKYLNDNGIKAKQVCYDTSISSLSAIKRVKKFLICIKSILNGILHPQVLIKINKRNRAFVEFRDKIPHTSDVYTYKNIKNADCAFDAFITGSDQVWNPIVVNDGYSLLFSDKLKYSYAASVASDRIPQEKMEYYKDFLKSFVRVSVRERAAQEILPIESTLVLDPVFFFSSEHWENIATPRLISEPYVFCYFLGDSLNDRRAAIKYAHDKKLKVVNIPYLKNSYRKCDNIKFDFSVCDITPNDFLSLILNSEYVFTDSFHAVCFSYIFKKQFFAFDRKTKAKMNSRIKDILYTFDLTDRFIENPDKVPEKYTNIDYKKQSESFMHLKKESVDYISSIIRSLVNQ